MDTKAIIHVRKHEFAVSVLWTDIFMISFHTPTIIVQLKLLPNSQTIDHLLTKAIIQWYRHTDYNLQVFSLAKPFSDQGFPLYL